MSGSNPFRRSSFKQAGTNLGAPVQAEDEFAGADPRHPTLTLEAPPIRAATSTKHVRIASPPVPISPETPQSYASSPLSTRQSSQVSSPTSHDPQFSGFGSFPDLDPFERKSTGSFGAGDGVAFEDVSQSGGRYPMMGIISSSQPRSNASDPVQDTISRFASTSRTVPTPLASDSGAPVPPHAGRGRPAMDVDAFKRLLLTGEAGTSSITEAAASLAPTLQHNSINDSSSNTDTASISRHSLLESMRPVSLETPRTSHELDNEDAEDERKRLVEEDRSGTRKKPPIPRTRRGKLIKSNPTLAAPGTNPSMDTDVLSPISSSGFAQTADLNKPLPAPPFDVSSPSKSAEMSEPSLYSFDLNKKPPTPPITRRQTQLQGLQLGGLRNSPSRQSFGNDSELESPSNSSSNSQINRIPPAPPLRRSNRSNDAGISLSEVLPAREETTSDIQKRSATSPARSIDQGRPRAAPPPPPSRATSSARVSRMSMNMTAMVSSAPPPPPPPRKSRGSRSSRGSVDSLRPAVDSLVIDTGQSSVQLRRPSTDSSRRVSDGASNASDILGEIAALQRDVDALRIQKGGGKPGIS